MIGVSPVFPGLELPEGWTREVKGPKLWLVPPAPGGRIVVPPLQARPRGLPASMFLERVLLQEADRFPRIKQSEPITVTSAQHVPGLFVDVAMLDASDQPTEWRCYVLFATDAAFALLFLQSKPAVIGQLRPVFLELASTVTLPEAAPSEAGALDEYEEL
jgi:hypothetical protein